MLYVNLASVNVLLVNVWVPVNVTSHCFVVSVQTAAHAVMSNATYSLSATVSIHLEPITYQANVSSFTVGAVVVWLFLTLTLSVPLCLIVS